MFKMTAFALFLLSYTNSFSQDTTEKEESKNNYLKIYYDCQYCDVTFIKQNLNLVEFVRDQSYSDVHILINSQQNGSGASTFNIRFIGKGEYLNLIDTLYYATTPDMSNDDKRRLQLKYVELGLVRFFLKKGLESELTLKINKKEEITAIKKDPWNYWVFKLNASGWFNGQESYQNTNLYFNANIKRVTDKNKFNLQLNKSVNNSVYVFGNDKIVNNQQSSSFYLSDVISINDHWSYGGFGSFRNSIFSNYRTSASLKAGIEYDIFKYSESANKQITFSYTLGGLYNDYYDTTVFNKSNELLWLHKLNIGSSFKQKWGNISGSISYSNYLHDFELNEMNFYLNMNIRIYKGLSWRLNGSYSIQHNQINLKKDGVTLEDVLLQQQQLKSGFNYWFSTGLSYSFGSIYNTVVNPRFDG